MDGLDETNDLEKKFKRLVNSALTSSMPEEFCWKTPS